MSSSDPPENRTPVLLVSCSTLLFNAVLALTFHSWWKALVGVEDTEDFDPTEAWSIGVRALVYAASRYCLLNVGFAGCGLIGTLMRNTQMLRVFALGSLVDCTAILFILVAFLIFTLSPSLSGPFADLVCSEITRGESFGLTSYLREKETKWGIRGLDIVLWGRETCEENWAVGVLSVFLGVLVLALVRVYTTWITWDLYLKVERTGRKYWNDLEAEQGEKIREMMTMTEGSKRRTSRSRSNTLPTTSATHGRFKSHSIPALSSHSDTDAQGRPRLVLVPVFFDPSAPPQPSSAPAYTSFSPRSTSLSPSISSSASSTSSSSSSSHRNHSYRSHHARRQSMPISPSSASASSTSSASSPPTSASSCHSTSSRSPRNNINIQYRSSPSSSSSSSEESKSPYFDYFHHGNGNDDSSSVYTSTGTGTGTGASMKRSRSRSENSVLLGNWSTATMLEEGRGLMITGSDGLSLSEEKRS